MAAMPRDDWPALSDVEEKTLGDRYAEEIAPTSPRPRKSAPPVTTSTLPSNRPAIAARFYPKNCTSSVPARPIRSGRSSVSGDPRSRRTSSIRRLTRRQLPMADPRICARLVPSALHDLRHGALR